jgi:pyrroline-5-carboxylate reductase
MGEALLDGLVRAGWARADELAVAAAVPERRAELAAAHPGVTVVDAPVEADGALVAVKPKDVVEVCGALRSPRVLSIAAGVPISAIEGAVGPGVAVVRAMPNTPLQVGEGASAIAGGSAAGDGDLAWAEAILGALGLVVRVPEDLLDAVTGLSGSGPAYVFLVAEALRDAGVAAGLPPDVAALLAAQTLLGSARLLTSTGQAPESLRAQVTTPGGTTEAGLAVLEAGKLREIFALAVAAATARSRELGAP